jgi:signal transduction histidine kinase
LTSSDKQARLSLPPWLVATVGALSALLIAASLGITRLDASLREAMGPKEGYYWTVAQYQIGFLRLQQTLRAAAAGEPIDSEELTRRTAVLVSKTRILTEPSELTAFFHGVPGYSDAAKQLADFESQVVPQLERPAFGRAEAQRALQAFGDMDRTLITLSNDVRLEEINRRDATLQAFLDRRTWLQLAVGAAFLALSLLLIFMYVSRRRFQRAAEERRVALDAERTAKQAMQEAVQAKMQFLGMVSHELRSPLQSIQSALDVLELRGAQANHAKLVPQISRAADALNAQLRDLLTLARGEAGKLEIKPESFDAAELVTGVAEAIRPAAQVKGLALNVQVAPGAVRVVTDPARIGQVLTNLIENAVKYTASGSVDVVLHTIDAAEPRLAISVRDTGPGIPQEFLPKIFAPYRRFGSLGGAEGYGIGLAVVNTVVEHLGGKVGVVSREGEGTTFTVSIPVAVPEQAPKAPTKETARHVLVVDDRSDVRDALVDVISELGIECDEADSAAAGANLLATRVYDAVLIDLDMPVKRGVELASETRRGGLNSDGYFIAISAAEGRAEGSAWPFDAFLQKPIDRQALVQAIGRRDLGSSPMPL